MAVRAEKFAQLLTQAIYRIRVQESKTIGAVQDELGYALGKQGGASIEYWRKGNVPSKQNDIEMLAREIMQRSDLGQKWLADFLRSADYPHVERLVADLVAAPVMAPAPPPARVTPTAAIDLPPQHNLPFQPTPFIGRADELVTITERLDDPSCKLLTLVGPGGIGKTRLALQAASGRLDAYPNGVYFVSLLALSSTDFLVSAIADALHLSFYSGESPKSQLLSFLQAKRMLLIVDNFEHLIQEVGLLVEMLQSAPGLKIIVTSRERLNLRGEWVFQVPGMPFPRDMNFDATESNGSMESYSAVQLFLQSARRVHSDFALSPAEQPFVARICQLVEGIPLGIELAAAWVKLLSCEEIAREIEQNYEFLATSWRDMPERHRSLQAVFDYSWELISDQEREVMGRLSVFRGGFSREAAQKVAGASLLTLSALVDKSFLHRKSGRSNGMVADSEIRYEMHELLRQYADEKLNELTGRLIDGQFVSLEQKGARDRHSAYYAAFLHEHRQELRGGRQKEVLEQIGEEIENIRAAWRWAIQQGLFHQIGQSLSALFYFYDIRGWTQEGVDAFAAAVARFRELEPHQEGEELHQLRLVLGQALSRHGRFYHRLGQYERAKPLVEEGLTIFQELDEPRSMAIALNYLGKIAYRVGEYLAAQEYCQESLIICRQINYTWGKASALETLGTSAESLGNYDQAKERFLEGLLICREIDDRRGIATFLNDLGFVNWRLGAYDDAEQFCKESLDMYRELGDKRGMSLCYKNLGNIASNLGNYGLAESNYSKGLILAREIGYQWGIAALLNNSGNIAWEQDKFDEAKRFCRESVEMYRRIGDLWGVAGSLETLGSVAIARGEWSEAQAYLQSALEIGLEIQATPLALGVLIGLTRLMAHKGDRLRAMEIMSFVIHHPSTDKEVANRAARHFVELAMEFPQEMVDAAEERGKQCEFDAVMADIMQFVPEESLK